MSSFTSQLVLQLPATVLDGFDEMVALEDAIIEALRGHPHIVDGHDIGSGEVNFFIHTNDPAAALAIAIEAFGPRERAALRAAFRRFDGDDYTNLWPRVHENLSMSFELCHTSTEVPQRPTMRCGERAVDSFLSSMCSPPHFPPWAC
jgi:hypothetical protein